MHTLQKFYYGSVVWLEILPKVRAGERGHYLHHGDVLVKYGEGERRGLPGLWED